MFCSLPEKTVGMARTSLWRTPYLLLFLYCRFGVSRNAWSALSVETPGTGLVWTLFADKLLVLACLISILLGVADRLKRGPDPFLVLYRTEFLRKFCTTALEQLRFLTMLCCERLGRLITRIWAYFSSEKEAKSVIADKSIGLQSKFHFFKTIHIDLVRIMYSLFSSVVVTKIMVSLGGVKIILWLLTLYLSL